MNGLALCAGVGGLELGIERVFPNFRNVAFVEGEAFAVSNLVKKMEEGSLAEAPIWSDLRSFDGRRFRGKVDLISAGFPCTPFSKAGKLEGTEDERYLWPHVSRIISEVRPKIIVLENVAGVVNLAGSAIFADLAEMGFDCAWGIVRASEARAPHQRARFFAVAVDPNTDNNGFKPFQKSSKNRLRSMEEESNVDTRSRTSGICSTLAHSDGQRSQKSTLPDFLREEIPNIERGRQNVADSSNRFDLWEEEEIHSRRNAVNPCSSNRDRGYRQRWNFREEWSPEPRVGRVVDGVADWVDRIRACGNGVVPQQAELAIRILIETLIDRKAEIS